MDLSAIKNFCRKRNGGLKKLAADIGMSEPNLHRCIRENKIQASDLEKIALLLGMDIRIFFDLIETSEGVTITNGSAAAVNVHAPINAPITASSSENAKIEALTAELAHANALLESTRQILSEREQLIKEKERLIQLLLKQ